MGIYDTPEELTVWGIIARDLAKQAEILNAERKLSGKDGLVSVPESITSLGLDAYTPDRFIQRTCWPTIDIIASCANAAFVEFASGEYRMSVPQWSFFGCMDRFLDALPHDKWDIVIFDNPPAIGYQALNAVFAADVLYVPFGPAYWEYDSTTSFVNQLGDALEEVSRGFAKSSEIKAKLPKRFLAAKYLLTRFDSNNPVHGAMLECVEMAFRDRVAKNHIELTRAVEQSGRQLQSIYEIDYREMTRETWRRARRSFDAAFDEFITTIRDVWNDLPDVNESQNETEAA
jgi:cellulose biosynthesis protein BcsQ